MLTLIDCFSERGWTILSKNKSPHHWARADGRLDASFASITSCTQQSMGHSKSDLDSVTPKHIFPDRDSFIFLKYESFLLLTGQEMLLNIVQVQYFTTSLGIFNYVNQLRGLISLIHLLYFDEQFLHVKERYLTDSYQHLRVSESVDSEHVSKCISQFQNPLNIL